MGENEALLSMHLAALDRIYQKLNSQDYKSLVPAIRKLRVVRMNQTYADLYGQQRYRAAVEFLVEDLLGANDLSSRDTQLQKASAAMIKILPGALLGTVAKAVELTVLSMELDMQIAQWLHDAGISAERLSDQDIHNSMKSVLNHAGYIRQVDMVCLVGREIETVVHRPFISTALKMCRKPAQLMGLAYLQDYLERGFNAFKKMRGSAEFLSIFEQREKHYLKNVFER